MKAQKRPASPPPSAPSSSPPAPPSSSLVADLFGAKDALSSSAPSLVHSMFPPASTVMGKDSSRSRIIGNSGKHEAQGQTQDAKNVTTVNMCPDGISEGDANRDINPAYQQQKIVPCSFSSSLYYGGQDIYISSSASIDYDDVDYKTNEEDDSNNPNAVSRGNWWQGSLYY